MKYLTVLWLVLGCTLLAPAQTLTIQDQVTGAPVAGATLSAKNFALTTATDARGQAALGAFKAAVGITIRCLGYSSVELSFAEIEAAGFVVQLVPQAFDLEGVVVSANRWQQLSTDLPQAIAAITPAEMALQNPQTAADLLGISGKVFIQKSQ